MEACAADPNDLSNWPTLASHRMLALAKRGAHEFSSAAAGRLILVAYHAGNRSPDRRCLKEPTGTEPGCAAPCDLRRLRPVERAQKAFLPPGCSPVEISPPGSPRVAIGASISRPEEHNRTFAGSVVKPSNRRPEQGSSRDVIAAWGVALVFLAAAALVVGALDRRPEPSDAAAALHRPIAATPDVSAGAVVPTS